MIKIVETSLKMSIQDRKLGKNSKPQSKFQRKLNNVRTWTRNYKNYSSFNEWIDRTKVFRLRKYVNGTDKNKIEEQYPNEPVAEFIRRTLRKIEYVLPYCPLKERLKIIISHSLTYIKRELETIPIFSVRSLLVRAGKIERKYDNNFKLDAKNRRLNSYSNTENTGNLIKSERYNPQIRFKIITKRTKFKKLRL